MEVRNRRFSRIRPAKNIGTGTVMYVLPNGVLCSAEIN